MNINKENVVYIILITIIIIISVILVILAIKYNKKISIKGEVKNNKFDFSIENDKNNKIPSDNGVFDIKTDDVRFIKYAILPILKTHILYTYIYNKFIYKNEEIFEKLFLKYIKKYDMDLANKFSEATICVNHLISKYFLEIKRYTDNIIDSFNVTKCEYYRINENIISCIDEMIKISENMQLIHNVISDARQTGIIFNKNNVSYVTQTSYNINDEIYDIFYRCMLKTIPDFNKDLVSSNAAMLRSYAIAKNNSIDFVSFVLINVIKLLDIISEHLMTIATNIKPDILFNLMGLKYIKCDNISDEELNVLTDE